MHFESLSNARIRPAEAALRAALTINIAKEIVTDQFQIEPSPSPIMSCWNIIMKKIKTPPESRQSKIDIAETTFEKPSKEL